MSILPIFQLLAENPTAEYAFRDETLQVAEGPVDAVNASAVNRFLNDQFKAAVGRESNPKKRTWVNIDGKEQSLGAFVRRFPRFAQYVAGDLAVEDRKVISVEVDGKTFDGVDLDQLKAASKVVRGMIEDYDAPIDRLPLPMFSEYDPELVELFLKWVAGDTPQNVSFSHCISFLKMANAIDAEVIFRNCLFKIGRVEKKEIVLEEFKRLPPELREMAITCLPIEYVELFDIASKLFSENELASLFNRDFFDLTIFSSLEEYIEKVPYRDKITTVHLKHLDKSDIDGILYAWAALFPNATEVSLPAWIKRDDLHCLSFFPNLALLTVDKEAIEKVRIEEMASFRALTSSLAPSQIVALFNAGIIDLSIFSSLEEFKGKVPYHKEITRVDFSCVCGDDGFANNETYADWGSLFPNASEVIMPIQTADADLAVLRFFPKLTKFNLAMCSGLTEEGFRHLANTPQLREIDLSESKNIDFGGLKHAKGLTELDLAYAQVDEIGEGPRGLGQVTNLERLRLTGACFYHLCGLERLVNLKFLKLYEMDNLSSLDPITEILEKIPLSLEMLGIKGNDWMTAEALEFIKKRLPTCTIL